MSTELKEIVQDEYIDAGDYVDRSEAFKEDHGGSDTLTDYLQKGTDTGVQCEGGIAVWDEDGRAYSILGNLVYYVDELADYFWNPSADLDADPCAILVPKRKGFDVVHNGDEDNVYHNLQDLIPDAPTVSFRCINRLLDLDESDHIVVGQMCGKKQIVFVDYTPDSKLPVTAAQRAKYRAKVKAYRVKHGYDPVNARDTHPDGPRGYTFMPGGPGVPYKWHRAATVLFRDTRKRGASYMLGQDEGTYFGLELPGHPKTIDKAFESLVPRSIRKIEGVKRQGEWFVVPLSEDEVPHIHECVEVCGDAILPKDDADSNNHEVDGGHVIVGPDGTVYAQNSRLSHDEHEAVRMEGWCKYVVSTAVRSVSVEGVD
jgi:hypothetical protein